MYCQGLDVAEVCSFGREERDKAVQRGFGGSIPAETGEGVPVAVFGGVNDEVAELLGAPVGHDGLDEVEIAESVGLELREDEVFAVRGDDGLAACR